MIPPGGNVSVGRECSQFPLKPLTSLVAWCFRFRTNQPVAHHERYDAEEGGRAGWTHGSRSCSSSVWSGPVCSPSTDWVCGWRQPEPPSKQVLSPEASSRESTPCPG